MRKFGLIGYPLSHSFSKKFFTEKFIVEEISDCEYELYPISSIDLFPGLLSEEPDLVGINVTIPYKVDVMPFLDEVDDAAAEIGAVNCIHITNSPTGKRLKGYNTDAYGFEASLTPLLEVQHSKALVFGNGGAAKAVKYVLKKLNIPFLVVSRNPELGQLGYHEITPLILNEYTILINTTPLGMSPHTATCPEIPYHALSANHLAYDLVYNPEQTTFLAQAQLNGAVVKNGLEMLYLQAERSWFIWNN